MLPAGTFRACPNAQHFILAAHIVTTCKRSAHFHQIFKIEEWKQKRKQIHRKNRITGPSNAKIEEMQIQKAKRARGQNAPATSHYITILLRFGHRIFSFGALQSAAKDLVESQCLAFTKIPSQSNVQDFEVLFT
jgi:hypothetical protein